MGGIGSGTWYRFGKQSTTEEHHSVDIRFLKKQGFLVVGTSGTLSWSCGGEPTGNIRFITHHNFLQLLYKCRPAGGEWTDKRDIIKFDRTPCNYGNYRTWLLCPHCGKRVTSVYGLTSGFLCRHCYNLPYASQRENKLERMVRKMRKISVKTGGDTCHKKPKGMHWKTYNKLVTEENRACEHIDSAIYDMSFLLKRN